MRIVILGPPGSGKGTISGIIGKEYGIVHISTGDLFRYNIREKTPIGLEAKSYMDRGDLVPDQITIAMLEERVGRPDCEKGFLLDGYPRTIEQAEALDVLMQNKGWQIDIALNVCVPETFIMKRLAGRRVCPQCGATYNVYTQPPKKSGICDACGARLVQRPDDTEETIHHRLETYEESTKPLIDFYENKGILKNVDNRGAVEETMAQVKKVLN